MFYLHQAAQAQLISVGCWKTLKVTLLKYSKLLLFIFVRINLKWIQGFWIKMPYIAEKLKKQNIPNDASSKRKDY